MVQAIVHGLDAPLSGAVVQSCRNVPGFKTFYECRSNAMSQPV